jgi:hypothetical protein
MNEINVEKSRIDAVSSSVAADAAADIALDAAKEVAASQDEVKAAPPPEAVKEPDKVQEETTPADNAKERSFFGSIADKASSIKNSAAGAASSVTDAVVDTASSVKNTVADTASSIKESVSGFSPSAVAAKAKAVAEKVVAKVKSIADAADKMIIRLFHIIAIFILNTLVVPLAVLFIFYTLAKSVMAEAKSSVAEAGFGGNVTAKQTELEIVGNLKTKQADVAISGNLKTKQLQPNEA